MENHYQTLGLKEGASQEAIQEAYDRLYKELNPANNNNQDFFIEEFEKLEQAYKVLHNSSILSSTSEASEASSSDRTPSTVKKSIGKLKPKTALKQSKLKNKKIIIVAIGLIIIVLIAYVIFLPKQFELSEITLTNNNVYSAFTRSDMKPLDGSVKGVGKFVNGIAEGEHKVLNKKGNTIAEGYYKNGKKHGFWKEWYTIKDGEWHFWYEKGVLKKECSYSNGKLDGEYRTWFSNGQLENIGTYKNGVIKGEWRYYDKNGKLLAHFNYDGEIWADKNLDVSRYRNGDLIPEVKDTQEWRNLTTGAWCYYNNDPRFGAIFGKLYNWYAVNDPRGLAPEGYHIPTLSESRIFFENFAKVKYLYNDDLFLRYGYNNFVLLNKFGFSEISSPRRNFFGNFDYYGERVWWCGTNVNTQNAIAISASSTINRFEILLSEGVKIDGCYVRCIRN
jgi:uncharacterized protein (TIGR02145 family)